MFFAITILVILTVALAALVLAPRLKPENLVCADVPDRPIAFGPRMSWIAIRTRDTERVVEALSLHAVQPSNWSSGIGTVYDKVLGETRVFVSPPAGGWTFVVGLSLPQTLGRGFVDKTLPLLLSLGDRFIEVQYYLSYPAIDFYAWARIVDGKLVRAYAVGDEGVLWSKGKQSKEERALGLKLYELRGVAAQRAGEKELVLYPTESHLMKLAGKWSLDPTRVGEAKAEPALGFVGIAPASWRPERAARKAA